MIDSYRENRALMYNKFDPSDGQIYFTSGANQGYWDPTSGMCNIPIRFQWHINEDQNACKDPLRWLDQVRACFFTIKNIEQSHIRLDIATRIIQSYKKCMRDHGL